MAASTNYDHVVVTTNSQQQGSTTLMTAPTLIYGAAASAALATNQYLPAQGGILSTTALPLGLATQACTIKNLNASLATAPGGTDTTVVTVMTSTDNGATYTSSALTCTVSGTLKVASDTSHAVALAAGTRVAIKMLNSSTTAADFVIAFEMA